MFPQLFRFRFVEWCGFQQLAALSFWWTNWRWFNDRRRVYTMTLGGRCFVGVWAVLGTLESFEGGEGESLRSEWWIKGIILRGSIDVGPPMKPIMCHLRGMSATVKQLGASQHPPCTLAHPHHCQFVERQRRKLSHFFVQLQFKHTPKIRNVATIDKFQKKNWKKTRTRRRRRNTLNLMKKRQAGVLNARTKVFISFFFYYFVQKYIFVLFVSWFLGKTIQVPALNVINSRNM